MKGLTHNSPRICVIINNYLPGYKAGGPIRTLATMVERLGDEFEFKIITSDRDLGDDKAYPNVALDEWRKVGKAQVIYLPNSKQKLFSMRKLLRSMEYDVLYLNGVLSKLINIVIFLKRTHQLKEKPTIIASRGVFSQGSLKLKWRKKRIYLWAAGALGLLRGFIWQVSSEFEAEDIKKIITQYHLDDGPTIFIAPNLSPEITFKDRTMCLSKEVNSARIIFLSRIGRVKNLVFTLTLLKSTFGEVKFDIYGSIEDSLYWQECQRIIDALPNNIQVSYHGSIPADRVQKAFANYHAFLFPTLGENFGHVILEALSAGCPVIISDRTPWRNLSEKMAGWDIPLEQPDVFERVIQKVVDMDQITWEKWSKGARKVAEDFINNPDIVEANRQLFYWALSQK